ncbi:MAG TPA: hypothetical protein VJC15_04230 [Candidatus Paceibacterota bacterium]
MNLKHAFLTTFASIFIAGITLNLLTFMRYLVRETSHPARLPLEQRITYLQPTTASIKKEESHLVQSPVRYPGDQVSFFKSANNPDDIAFPKRGLGFVALESLDTSAHAVIMSDYNSPAYFHKIMDGYLLNNGQYAISLDT